MCDMDGKTELFSVATASRGYHAARVPVKGLASAARYALICHSVLCRTLDRDSCGMKEIAKRLLSGYLSQIACNL